MYKIFQRVTSREIKKKDLPDYPTFNCIDTAYTNLTAALQNIDNGNSKLWFDSCIMEVIRPRGKFKERFSRTKLHVDHELFKEQRNLVQQKIKNEKTNFVKNQLQKNTKKPKKPWKVLKKCWLAF